MFDFRLRHEQSATRYKEWKEVIDEVVFPRVHKDFKFKTVGCGFGALTALELAEKLTSKYTVEVEATLLVNPWLYPLKSITLPPNIKFYSISTRQHIKECEKKFLGRSVITSFNAADSFFVDTNALSWELYDWSIACDLEF